MSRTGWRKLSTGSSLAGAIDGAIPAGVTIKLGGIEMAPPTVYRILFGVCAPESDHQ